MTELQTASNPEEQKKNTPCRGIIHSTESFGSVDGPGVRFVVFLQGCSLRCQFCHNPDTWKRTSDNQKTAEELLAQALRFRTYWGEKGGITVSGGEPLLQIDFLIELFTKAKAAGVHTALDTSGGPFTMDGIFFEKFQTLMQVTDLVLLDLKHIDNERHRLLTGQGNTNILALARYLSDIKKPVWIRHVLVPGINDADEYLTALDAFVQSLGNVERFEVLPYHTLGIYKWKELGIPYQLEETNPPGAALVAHANALLHTADYQSPGGEIS